MSKLSSAERTIEAAADLGPHQVSAWQLVGERTVKQVVILARQTCAESTGEPCNLSGEITGPPHQVCIGCDGCGNPDWPQTFADRLAGAADDSAVVLQKSILERLEQPAQKKR